MLFRHPTVTMLDRLVIITSTPLPLLASFAIYVLQYNPISSANRCPIDTDRSIGRHCIQSHWQEEKRQQ